MIYTIKDGKKIDLRDLIDYTDRRTIEYLANSKYLETIFQTNSMESHHLLKQILNNLFKSNELTEVKVISAISDVTTLIRPASKEAGAVERYLDRMNGKEVESPISITSPFWEIVSQVTSNTYYELLYQEQIMILLSSIYNISYGKADTIRRVFEKKDSMKLSKLKKEFWEIWKNKATVEECAEFWKYLLSVSGYLFNLSHAVSYSYNTYQTAYLKIIPEISLSVDMNINSDKLDKVQSYIKEANDIGIKIMLPKFNKCYAYPIADINEHIIYLSPNMLKGIGKAVSTKLSKKNDFKDLDSFLNWCYVNGINKAVMEIFIEIDFFSQFGNKQYMWDYINNFHTSKQEMREKKFIKKYNKFIYKPKKGENVVEENGFNNSCLVEIKEKCWDLSPFEDKSSSKASQLLIEMKYLGFPISSLKNLYSSEQYENDAYNYISNNYFQEDILLITNIRNGNKGMFKYSILTDIYGDRYFLPKYHFMYSNGFVIRATIAENDKGKTIASYSQIDYIKIK